MGLTTKVLETSNNLVAWQYQVEFYLSSLGSRSRRMPSRGLLLYAGCRSSEKTALPSVSTLASIQPQSADMLPLCDYQF